MQQIISVPPSEARTHKWYSCCAGVPTLIMEHTFVVLLSIRILISCLGLVGNVLLIAAVALTKHSPVKSFELFLLGLATANLEEILIVSIYDVILLKMFHSLGTWWCGSFRFLTMFGEEASIYFSVLISFFRYEKMRDASKRANVPVYLDSLKSAWMVSGICVMLSTLLSFPMFFISLQSPAENITTDRSTCPPDFFQCQRFRPQINCFYKYLFVVMCNLLPLIIITATSCLTLQALVSQGKTVTPELGLHGSSHSGKGPWFQRSTIDVLAAMILFQVVWIFYLVLQLTSDFSDLHFKSEIKFFIAICYTSICPYVYGIGGHLFSLKIFIKR
ncbi:uncharacterized protein LOC114849475 [Betta splendens]|uniref:Uncharacterized protein LOC114849475 n=1 Tax=Betta splendens TaxID=158456 RepID=A0A6P7LPM5_BETSP|nr:uncharacterized protein LOC114849475 [Betta splendens]XP_028996799.1 uncharacterized protein LOC114849475 [Betta splendens]XP_028996801.1 uncharacterized protein LOC114849475 [Betta splendens]